MLTKIKLCELKNYEKNSRVHSPDQIEIIRKSIVELGFLDPVEIDQNNIILSGHARVEAAKLAGLTEVPVVIHHLTDVQRRAYVIAANRIAQSAGWDFSLLKDEILELKEGNFNLDILGFNNDELLDILNPEMPNIFDDESDYDSSKDENFVNTGDIWQLGDHILACADSTDVAFIEPLFVDKEINIMVTDPPYGVNYDPAWREAAGKGTRATDKVENDHIVDWSSVYALFRGNVVYVWHASSFTHIIAKNLIDCGFNLVSQIIWAKQHFALSRGDYHFQHEPCWYAVRKGEKHSWRGGRDKSTVWNISNNNAWGGKKEEDNEITGHGTQKPLECMLWPIENHTRPNDWVYDPFGGSGTTLIACEKIGRKCLMVEINEQYCSTIIRRWERLTSKKAWRINEPGRIS